MAKKKKCDYKKVLKDFSKNYWAISTVVLAALLIVTLLTGGISGAVVSANVAGQRVLDFANNQGANAELISVGDNGALYEVVLSIEGQEVPVYVTKDGKTLVPQPIPLEETAAPEATPSQPEQTEIPKSNKPSVELYVWSYCPYGVQAQGPLAQVAGLLKDDTDLTVKLYYDGHGAYETQQNKIQACIQKVDNENYWDYAAGFVETIYPKCGASRDIECDLSESTKLMDSVGIDSDAVLSCVESEGADLIAKDANDARTAGVTGSPTLIINGVKANVARSAEAFKGAICSAFNDAPETCSTALDATAGTAAGNC